jgi:D-methionine transport system substrate-binding protein
MKRFGILLLATFSILFLAHCSKPSQEASNVIRIGTIAGPETELLEAAKSVAKDKYNLDVKIVEFTDYVIPNQALADKSIDANAFQHLPYLEGSIAAKGYKLVPIGKTFIYPMGIYSKKITHLADLKNEATVAIPNDPSNEARALLLLQKAGLITLKPGATLKATIHDIIANPKHLNIKELDAAQLPRILNDVDIAAVNTNYALVAGLLPSRDALFIEGTDSPYANIVVIRAEDKDNPKYKKLMDAIHSPEVIAKAKKLFQGQAIPAWQSD